MVKIESKPIKHRNAFESLAESLRKPFLSGSSARIAPP